MIKAEELRINNWVEYAGKYKQIAMIESNGKNEHFVKFKDGLSGPKIKCSDIEPIKPDLKIKKQINGLKIPIDEAMNCFQLEVAADIVYKIVMSDDEFYFEYKYLHQIQNLYFSLAHQELEIIL